MTENFQQPQFSIWMRQLDLYNDFEISLLFGLTKDIPRKETGLYGQQKLMQQSLAKLGTQNEEDL